MYNEEEQTDSIVEDDVLEMDPKYQFSYIEQYEINSFYYPYLSMY